MEIRSFLIVLMMSKFNIFASDSKSYVRIHQVRSCIQNPESYNKAFNGSVMVWCTFSTAGPGILHFIQGAMNPNTYRDIFKTKFSQCVQEMSLGNNWRFYPDNDPKYKEYRRLPCLLYKCPCIMETPL
ncbi:hypothetical protein CEXT_396642 [Caerostris extrusa]|uniref:Secreted protein n=1 Tax=Caerostris extrusa TaxID=172846 RepID=A0AAV4N6R2_CAEEX|nr:hypothetical protein CEXT_396642 [Caerostris extrusa]